MSSRALATASIDQVKVVSFDLDDTLWDLPPVMERAEELLYSWMQNNTPRITEALDRAALLKFREQFRQDNLHLKGCVTAMRTAALRSLMAAHEYDESRADEAFNAFYKARSEVALFPGVHGLLSALSRRYSLAAITNGNADLDAIGIAYYFNEVFAADLELKAKPSEDMFDRCCQAFSITHEQLLHIGDNPVTDVQGAQLAGVQSLWFNPQKLPWPEALTEPHFQANTLAQVETLLTQAGSSQ